MSTSNVSDSSSSIFIKSVNNEKIYSKSSFSKKRIATIIFVALAILAGLIALASLSVSGSGFTGIYVNNSLLIFKTIGSSLTFWGVGGLFFGSIVSSIFFGIFVILAYGVAPNRGDKISAKILKIGDSEYPIFKVEVSENQKFLSEKGSYLIIEDAYSKKYKIFYSQDENEGPCQVSFDSLSQVQSYIQLNHLDHPLHFEIKEMDGVLQPFLNISNGIEKNSDFTIKIVPPTPLVIHTNSYPETFSINPYSANKIFDYFSASKNPYIIFVFTSSENILPNDIGVEEGKAGDLYWCRYDLEAKKPVFLKFDDQNDLIEYVNRGIFEPPPHVMNELKLISKAQDLPPMHWWLFEPPQYLSIDEGNLAYNNLEKGHIFFIQDDDQFYANYRIDDEVKFLQANSEQELIKMVNELPKLLIVSSKLY